MWKPSTLYKYIYIYDIRNILHIYNILWVYERTRIHGSFDRKNGTIFVSRIFTPSPHFIPKIIAAPAGMLINIDGTALRNCLLDGRDRTMQEWTGPHGNAVYYGRDCAKTLITRDGTALQRSLGWAGPRRAALKRTWLWTGPHCKAVYYGQDRAGRALKRSLLWTVASFILWQSYNIVSQACAQRVFHCAFCMYTLSAHFANALMMQGIYHKPGTRPIWTGHTSNFPVHGEHARTCWLQTLGWNLWFSDMGTCHFLAWEMVPFFPDKNALHQCTLTVCACTSGIYVLRCPSP